MNKRRVYSKFVARFVARSLEATTSLLLLLLLSHVDIFWLIVRTNDEAKVERERRESITEYVTGRIGRKNSLSIRSTKLEDGRGANR